MLASKKTLKVFARPSCFAREKKIVFSRKFLAFIMLQVWVWSLTVDENEEPNELNETQEYIKDLQQINSESINTATPTKDEIRSTLLNLKNVKASNDLNSSNKLRRQISYQLKLRIYYPTSGTPTLYQHHGDTPNLFPSGKERQKEPL